MRLIKNQVKFMANLNIMLLPKVAHLGVAEIWYKDINGQEIRFKVTKKEGN